MKQLLDLKCINGAAFSFANNSYCSRIYKHPKVTTAKARPKLPFQRSWPRFLSLTPEILQGL